MHVSGLQGRGPPVCSRVIGVEPAAQAEFDAEQEYLKTLSYLTPEDQQKYTERQSVSFMYQKPPGFEAAMSKAAGEVRLQAQAPTLTYCFLGCVIFLSVPDCLSAQYPY